MLIRACLGVAFLLGPAAVSAGEWCTAIDGTTLRCGSERVKIEGIQAPPLGEPDGEQARERLQRRIRAGEVVVQRGGVDKYGRTLARVYVNGNRITQIDVTARSTKPR